MKKRRGGYLATAEGIKKLKEAKRVKKYTSYQEIAKAAIQTKDKVKRLFNPQWGGGKYKIGEQAVEAICHVLDLKPEEIVSGWYPPEIIAEKTKVVPPISIEKHDPSYYAALKKIEQAARDEVERLYLTEMELTELPPEIGQLTNLTELYLCNNSLSTLPVKIGQLTNLTLLNLNDNSLNTLPAEIGQLTNLTRLYLGSNSLSTVPAVIGQLTNLTELDLRNNSLSTLPAEIGKLTNLTKLNLNVNSLSTLPVEIGQLTNLTELDLDDNSLSTLPAEIGQLTNLTVLYLYNNSLNTLPAEITQLINLTELYLGDNSLETLPAEIGQLTNLRILYLSGNSLNTLPAEITQLTNLTVLYLDDNSLNTLPAEITQLTNLTELYLSGNSLNTLPAEIGQLINLTELDLSDNSLPIPPEVIAKYYEPETIINYYLSQLTNQQKPILEAKMLLVGQANVGKTCLKERLIRDRYDPTRNKTDGIDIENWTVLVEDKELQVNIWDFGGQEIMHSTHQFFLTKRSLYLLVLDTTQSEEENRIEYWLKIIQSFGKDAPVVIVGNKADQHPLDIDKTGLKQKYPQIKDFYEVSCDTAKGIPELKEFVKQEIYRLEHIDDLLPLPWFNIKEKLEDLDKDYIPYEQYESLCEAEGVKEEDKQRILIRLLNDLGIVLNFQDDPRLEDTHVLNPEWVTNGVYKILNDRNLIIEDRGILTISILKRILDKKRYPAHKHLFIIGMMRKFELCFDIEADKQFLIPDILPKEEPYTGEWENTLAFEYHYPVLPGSIISRFIVRMNHYIHKTTYWRSGVVLVHEGNLALVKADREDKMIKIRVKGKASTKRNLLTAIRSQFDCIHETIPGIVPVAKVPLIEHPEILLDYQELLGLEDMGEHEIAIGKLKQRIPLKQLLDGIEEPQNRLYKRYS